MDIYIKIGGSWAFPTFPLVRIKLVKQGPIIWRTPALVNKFTVMYANLEIELGTELKFSHLIRYYIIAGNTYLR